MITAVIIDDQQNCIDDLSLLLKVHCAEVNIIGTAQSGKKGEVIDGNGFYITHNSSMVNL